MDMLRYFVIWLKNTPTWALKISLIWNLPIVCCILWKRAWSDLFKTLPTWFNPIFLTCMLIIRSWVIFRKCEIVKISQLSTAGKHSRLIGFIYIGGVLKSWDQSLSHSMQQTIGMYHIKGDCQCLSWRVFQCNEKNSQKIHQKNLWKYFFEIFVFNNSNPPSIWER